MPGYVCLSDHFASRRVLEGCGLSVWGTSGLSDPYCQVLVLGNGPGIRSEVKRGQVHKRTVNPKFQDTFDFPVSSGKNRDLIDNNNLFPL